MVSRLTLLGHDRISDTPGAEILRPSLLPKMAMSQTTRTVIDICFFHLKMSICSPFYSYLNIEPCVTTFQNRTKTPSPTTLLRCPCKSSIRPESRPKSRRNTKVLSLSAMILLPWSARIQTPERLESCAQISDSAPPKTRLRLCKRKFFDYTSYRSPTPSLLFLSNLR